MLDGGPVPLLTPAFAAVVTICDVARWVAAPRPSGPKRLKVLAEHGGPSAAPPLRQRHLPSARVAAAGAERPRPKDTPHA